jgi:hypothetical protein
MVQGPCAHLQLRERVYRLNVIIDRLKLLFNVVRGCSQLTTSSLAYSFSWTLPHFESVQDDDPAISSGAKNQIGPKLISPKGVDLGVHVYKVSGQYLQQLPANGRTTAATSSHRLTTGEPKNSPISMFQKLCIIIQYNFSLWPQYTSVSPRCGNPSIGSHPF